MIEGALHHVSIIVPDEDRVVELASVLGLRLGRRQYVPQYEAECIFTEGERGVVEFIIATSGKLSTFNKGMGGLHHIAIAVDDLEATRRELAQKGIPFLETTPVEAGPIDINFVAPAYTRGVIVEYVQQREPQAAAARQATPQPGAQAVPDQARKSEQQLFKEVRALRAQGRGDAAMELLRDALRRDYLSAEGIEKAGRQIAAHLADSGSKCIEILMLGQCTTNWLSHCLTAMAWADGNAVRVRDGQYDNVMQELMAAASGDQRCDIVVLLPWTQRLLGSAAGAAQDRVDDELAFWQQAWQVASNQLSARVVQLGYDWLSPGPLGHHLSARNGGPVQLVRQMNDRLRDALPRSAYFVDVDQASGTMGRDRFYDARRYHWTKQPFSEEGAALLAHHIWAGVRAMITGPKKVLVLDLDNTLWGGVVGETGPLGIELGETAAGEAYRAFQQHVKEMARRGCVLAVASKNNAQDAREPFEKNPALALQLSDFAAFEANWEPKSASIRRIAQTLQLGLDSFVFFDDNPAEREHVRQMLPEVHVVEVPPEPASYVRALEGGRWFEALDITAEDLERSAQYQAEAQRRQAQESYASMDDYLRSLDMWGDVRAVDDVDMPRVVQLLGKTNQFNLTTRRHGVEVVRDMLGAPSSVGITVRVADRFADYGLVAVLLGVEEAQAPQRTLRLDTWLMSCRVIARTVEEFCLNCVVDEARAKGYARLVGEYIPTKKNGLVADLYDRLGFRRVADHPDGSVSYELDLEGAVPSTTFVARRP